MLRNIKHKKGKIIISQDFLFWWGESTTAGEELLQKQSKLCSHPKTKPRPTVPRGPRHSLHIGLAIRTRPLSAKSVNIMISGNLRIWGIDINGSW
jgi:hypothetical protein